MTEDDKIKFAAILSVVVAIAAMLIAFEFIGILGTIGVGIISFIGMFFTCARLSN